MVKITKTGSTQKQMAYAKRVWGAEGRDKKIIALDVGYSLNIANKTKEKIENTRGFNNAMAKLAQESNSIALQVMHELKGRGFENYSNKDLVGALNAISGAWAKFNPQEKKEQGNREETNKLRRIVMYEADRIPNTEPVATVQEMPRHEPETPVVNDPMDF